MKLFSVYLLKHRFTSTNLLYDSVYNPYYKRYLLVTWCMLVDEPKSGKMCRSKSGSFLKEERQETLVK